MSSNNHKNPSCEFAETLVSYLYDEIATGEKKRFETHLKSCAACAGELVDLQFTHSSILEWRDEEFSNLETPAFDIPASGPRKSFAAAAASSEVVSWQEKLRRLFAFNPALAAGALVVLTACLGTTLFLLNASNQTNIAESEKNRENAIDKNLAQATVSPNAEIGQLPERISNIAEKDSKKNLSPAPGTPDLSEKVKFARQVSVNKAVVKVSDNAPKNNAENLARSLKEPKNGVKKNATAPRRKTPSLIDADEDEDDSIRLTDLFAEVETK